VARVSLWGVAAVSSLTSPAAAAAFCEVVSLAGPFSVFEQALTAHPIPMSREKNNEHFFFIFVSILQPRADTSMSCRACVC
jgi:hypothetical protein